MGGALQEPLCLAQVQQEEAGGGCAAASHAALHTFQPGPPSAHKSSADGPGSQGASGARLTGALPVGGTVAGLVARTPSCVLRPRAFFVSWQGVLTLAFRRGAPLAWLACGKLYEFSLTFKQWQRPGCAASCTVSSMV